MSSNRIVHKLSLRPVIGSRFQPTGFPDLGAAVFQRPAQGSAANALLVESPQSMANWLEKATWDDGTDGQVGTLAGVPYVQIVDTEQKFLTSTRLEAHRLASAYVMEGAVAGQTGEVWMAERFGLERGKPLDNRHIARAVCALDPLSLIHGVFFARGKWPWQPKIARAVTCFIEAYGVQPAVSGGVKKDSVDPKGKTDTGYGMVPHQRVEYTADSIVAYVSVDLDQLDAYGLGSAGSELLRSIIDFQLATVFGQGLRLRTACDLEVVSSDGTTDIPALAEASQRLGEAIDGAADLLGEPVTLTWGSGPAAKKN